MHQNIPELLVFFVWYFSALRCYFSDYRSYYMFCNCQEEMATVDKKKFSFELITVDDISQQIKSLDTNKPTQ